MICLNPECNIYFSRTVIKGKEHHSQKYCCKKCESRMDYLRNSINYKWRLKKLTHMAKSRAKLKNLPFNLTSDYIIALWEHNSGKCEVTKQTFDLYQYGNKGQVSPRAPSIDRIVPELGYTIGNVRLITYHLNISLSDFGILEFERLIKEYSGVY